MDYRRAGLFCQHQQCRRRPVPPSRQQWLWLCSGHVCRASPDLCRSRRVRSELRCSRRCLCASRSELLCTGPDLLQHRLQHRLPQVALLQDAEVPLPQDPLLQGSQELLQHGLLDGLRPNLRRSGCLCSDVCRSGRLRTDLRRSGWLPQLS